MVLESEHKIGKKKKDRSSELENSSSKSSDEESNKKVLVLQKDMLRMMKEFKNMKRILAKTKNYGVQSARRKVTQRALALRINFAISARLLDIPPRNVCSI